MAENKENNNNNNPNSKLQDIINAYKNSVRKAEDFNACTLTAAQKALFDRLNNSNPRPNNNSSRGL